MTTILAIEDERDVRENLQEILELEGFDVLIAENGKIGLKMAIEQKPDLIICDVMMPELDGYGVIAALRQNPIAIEIPFIFLSAKFTNEDREKGLRLGANDYLTKPFTPQDICKAIESMQIES
jgi:two-component system, sensor histidine kinase and response regulator